MQETNYQKSRYITLAIEPYSEKEINDMMPYFRQEAEEYGGDAEDYARSYAESSYEEYYDTADRELEGRRAGCFTAEAMIGLYEGAQVVTGVSSSRIPETAEGIEEGTKEADELGKALTRLAEAGFRECLPGCGPCGEDRFLDYGGTVLGIADAVRRMKRDLTAMRA